jgi:hypothetical protein
MIPATTPIVVQELESTWSPTPCLFSPRREEPWLDLRVAADPVPVAKHQDAWTCQPTAHGAERQIIEEKANTRASREMHIGLLSSAPEHGTSAPYATVGTIRPTTLLLDQFDAPVLRSTFFTAVVGHWVGCTKP